MLKTKLKSGPPTKHTPDFNKENEAKLQSLAKQTNRSLNWVINLAVVRFYEDWERATAEYKLEMLGGLKNGK